MCAFVQNTCEAGPITEKDIFTKTRTERARNTPLTHGFMQEKFTWICARIIAQ